MHDNDPKHTIHSSYRVTSSVSFKPHWAINITDEDLGNDKEMISNSTHTCKCQDAVARWPSGNKTLTIAACGEE